MCDWRMGGAKSEFGNDQCSCTCLRKLLYVERRLMKLMLMMKQHYYFFIANCVSALPRLDELCLGQPIRDAAQLQIYGWRRPNRRVVRQRQLPGRVLFVGPRHGATDGHLFAARLLQSYAAVVEPHAAVLW